MDSKKSLIALALVALVGIVGGTFAYFTSSTTLNNEFVTGTYSTSVKEEFVSPSNWTPGTTTTKKVNVTNNGSVDVAVRASYTEKWTAADGTTVLSGTRDGEQVAQFTIGSDWELATDGYYYYDSNLATGETSSDFISSVTFNPNFTLKYGEDISCTTSTADGKTTAECVNLTSGYAGATYTLEITLETIQADQKWTYIEFIGSEIIIGGEKFNIIRDNGDTVTMLAQYNLDTTYRQNATENAVKFSDSNGWEHPAGRNEIDIQIWSTTPKNYINNYVSYLQTETGDVTITGDLITMGELEMLGCTITADYSWSGVETCKNSKYVEWLNNNQFWWTRSSLSANSSIIWIVSSDGVLGTNYYNSEKYGVRPVITISKDTLKNL